MFRNGKILLILLLCCLVGISSGATLTQKFYPAIDGSLFNTTNTNISISGWSVYRNSPGETADTTVAETGPIFKAITTANTYDYLKRYAATFFINGITSNGTIQSGEFCFVSDTPYSSGLGTTNLTFTGFNPASNTSLAASDFNKFTDTVYTNEVMNSSLTYNQYYCTPFNADGIAAIDTGAGGYLRMMGRLGFDTHNDYTGAWSSNAYSLYSMFARSYAGTSKDPYVNVTWEVTDADLIPPASITGLTASLTDCNKTAFNWTIPGDGDYYQLQYYLNGTYTGNHPNTSTSIYFTGLPESESIIFSTHTVDLTGNVNQTWVNATTNTGSCAATPETDITPPDTITNINIPTINDVNATITWTTPTDADFYRSNFYRGDVWFSNYTNTTTQAFWCCLSPSTTYFINVTTEDLSGNRNMAWVNTSFTTIAGYPPTSSFIYTPSTGESPLSVSFNDTSTNTPTGWIYARNNLTHSTWEHIGITKNITVAFPAGNWSVNLSASNAYGSNISTQVSWVNVSEIPVIPPAIVIEANFAATPTSGTIDTSTFNVSFADSSINATSWYWDFGDGWASTDQNPVHSYCSCGIYDVSLTASNSDGISDIELKSSYITISEPPEDTEIIAIPIGMSFIILGGVMLVSVAALLLLILKSISKGNGNGLTTTMAVLPDIAMVVTIIVVILIAFIIVSVVLASI